MRRNYSLWSSLSELGALAHYYRYFEHIPALRRAHALDLVTAYKNRKKAMEYNRIWLRHNIEKSGNFSTKHRTGLLESERLLRGLSR